MGPPAGRAEAAEVIWDWRERSADRSKPRSFARERKQGSLRAAAGAVAGGLLFWIGWTTPARVVLAVAGLILVSALLSPGGLYATLDRIASALGRRIGWALTWILMVPLFYLFFLPFGVVFRHGKRDRLKRFFDPDADTYWEPHEGPTAASPSHENPY